MNAYRPIRTGREAVAEFERIAAELRARSEASVEQLRKQGIVPFPDPEGEDRDEGRVTTWDFRR